MPDFRVKFVYEHGSADRSELDLYDGATSLEGIARTLAITTHAFVNGKIRTHGDAAHGAKFYLRPTQRGSFVFDAVVSLMGACAASAFYDFLKYAFLETIGKPDDIEQQSVALQKRIEPTIGELPAALESSLKMIHRPIREDGEMTLTVMRPRGDLIVDLDKDTDSYLETRTIEVAHPIIGNVTRYNTISKWGKFYDRAEHGTVSFLLNEDLSDRERSLITWSLHESNVKREGTLYMYASAQTTPSGRVKRYNVHAVSQRPL